MSHDKVFEIETARIASPGSERAVLAVLFKDLNKFSEIIDILQSADFSSKYNSNLYTIAYDIFVNKKSEKLDKYTVIESANEKGLSITHNSDKNYEYLDNIIETQIDVSNIRNAAAKIKKLAVKREIYNRAREIQRNLIFDKEETLDQIIGESQTIFFNELKSLMSTDNVEPLSIGSYELINNRADNPKPLMGISTGFDRFDRIIGYGLRPGALNMIIGRAKAGKSCFLLQIANNVVVKSKCKVLYLDTEQNREEQQFRAIAQLTGVPIYELESGRWRCDKKYVDAIESNKKLINNPLLYYVKVTGMTPSEIINIIRRWALKELKYYHTGVPEPALVILDYIKVMSRLTMKDMTEWQALGLMVTEYKDLAESLGISMISAAQANRSAIGIGAGQIDASLIAASDRISWYASSCSILSAKLYEEIQEEGPNNGNVKLITILSRHAEGSQMNDWLNYRFDRKNTLRFEELGSNAERLASASANMNGDK